MLTETFYFEHLFGEERVGFHAPIHIRGAYYSYR